METRLDPSSDVLYAAAPTAAGVILAGLLGSTFGNVAAADALSVMNPNLRGDSSGSPRGQPSEANPKKEACRGLRSLERGPTLVAEHIPVAQYDSGRVRQRIGIGRRIEGGRLVCDM